MNILLITPMLHQGGFERICVSTARLLSADYNVTIATFSLDDVAYDIEGLNIINLNLPAVPGKVGKTINILKRRHALNRLVKKLSIDVVYSFGTTANKASCLISAPVRKLMACHSFEELKSGAYMKLMGSRADVIFCCARKMTEYVNSNYNLKQVHTLWNPCETDNILLSSADSSVDTSDVFTDANDTVLITMGREDDVKGYWHLLKIFRKIYETNRKVKLAVLGAGDFAEYKTLAKKLGIQDRVIFTGNKPNPFPYLAKADLFLMTSVSEGLPNVLVEALTLSIPIVSVNCQTGPAEILHSDMNVAEAATGVFYGDYGVLTPAIASKKDMNVNWDNSDQIILDKSEAAMSKAIIEILDNKERYKNYKEACAKRASDFSAEAYKNNLEQFL